MMKVHGRESLSLEFSLAPAGTDAEGKNSKVRIPRWRVVAIGSRP